MPEDLKDSVAAALHALAIVAAGGGFALAAWLIGCGLRARFQHRAAPRRRHP